MLGPDGLGRVLSESDFVVLTCPLVDATEGLISAAEMGMMKPSATLVNCARGAVVVEEELIAALKAGVIAGAAIDVTVEEPLGDDSALWGMSNVIITPHTGGETSVYEEWTFWLRIQDGGREGRICAQDRVMGRAGWMLVLVFQQCCCRACRQCASPLCSLTSASASAGLSDPSLLITLWRGFFLDHVSLP